MSSIVKKGQTSFTPKLRKNVPRRKQPEPPVFFSGDRTTETTEEDVDPRDTTQSLDVAVEEDEEEEEPEEEDYGDNDIFKKPEQPRRKSSVNRRLSGINMMKPGSRKGSVSISVRRMSVDDKAIPIPIEVPYKRRRKSSVRKTNKRVSISTTIEPTPEVGEPPETIPDPAPQEWESEEEEIEETQIEAEPVVTKLKRDDLYNNGTLTVYALNKRRTKLIKYRTGDLEGTAFEEEYSELPLAPEEIDITIKNRSQIPRSLRKDTSDTSESLAMIKLDHYNMTLKDLSFNELPIGKVSNNFTMAMDGKARDDAKRRTRREIRILARSKNISIEAATEEIENRPTKSEEDNKPEIKQEERKQEGKNIQLQIGAKGEIDVDPDSVNVSQQPNLDTNRTREETNPFEKPVLSTTYSKRLHTDKWTQDEDEIFFKALREWGTDFSLIATHFPYRNRKQIKAKFNSEEKKRPELVEILLRRGKSPDLEEYKGSLPGGIEDILDSYNESIRKIKAEHETQKREILKSKEKATLEDAEKNRLKEIERKTHSKPKIHRVGRDQLRSNEEVIGSVGSVNRK